MPTNSRDGARVRSGDYGIEVDIFSCGQTIAQMLRARSFGQEVAEALEVMSKEMTNKHVHIRPTAGQLRERLEVLRSSAPMTGGELRLPSMRDHVAAAAPQDSEALAVAAQPTPCRTLQDAFPNTEVPPWLDGVDADYMVYVSTREGPSYHHRDCHVVQAWHRSDRSHFHKERFADIAKRSGINSCSKCANRFPFTFTLGRGVTSEGRASAAAGEKGRPCPYPILDVPYNRDSAAYKVVYKDRNAGRRKLIGSRVCPSCSHVYRPDSLTLGAYHSRISKCKRGKKRCVDY